MMVVEILKTYKENGDLIGLNPSFNGWWSLSMRTLYRSPRAIWVLILLLMDDGRWVGALMHGAPWILSS